MSSQTVATLYHQFSCSKDGRSDVRVRFNARVGVPVLLPPAAAQLPALRDPAAVHDERRGGRRRPGAHDVRDVVDAARAHAELRQVLVPQRAAAAHAAFPRRVPRDADVHLIHRPPHHPPLRFAALDASTHSRVVTSTPIQ